GDGVLQGGAVDVLGGDPRPLGLRVGAEDRRDAEPADLAGLLHLGGEPAPHVRIPGPGGVEQLDGRPVPVGRLTEEDLAEPAPAEPSDQPVVADGLLLRPGLLVAHARLSRTGSARRGTGRTRVDAVGLGRGVSPPLGRLRGPERDDVPRGTGYTRPGYRPAPGGPEAGALSRLREGAGPGSRAGRLHHGCAPEVGYPVDRPACSAGGREKRRPEARRRDRGGRRCGGGWCGAVP